MQLGIKSLGIIMIISQFLNVGVMAQNSYFSSPQESVEISSKLLIEEDWEELSSYYSLGNTDEGIIDSLKNGSYFIREERPEATHPGGFWKYKHPFSPGFKYLTHSESGDTIKVDLIIEIDQGGGIIQQGRSSFYLKKSPKGYQHIL